jgi:uncharacterized protein
MSKIVSRIASFFSPGGRTRAQAGPTNVRIFNLTRESQVADRVQLAGEGRTRRKGLLGRDGLNAGEGLWIVPCEAVHTFWMRFAIDLIYLDREYRVLKIRSAVPPWRLSACLRAHSVVELAPGTINEKQVRRGDRLALYFE